MTDSANEKAMEVYEAILKSTPLSPTIRDIQEATGISSTSMVRYYLNILVDIGLIKRIPRSARGIIVLAK